MRTWLERFQALAVAVTFAERGEWQTARSFLKDERTSRRERAPERRERPDNRPRKPAYRA